MHLEEIAHHTTCFGESRSFSSITLRLVYTLVKLFAVFSLFYYIAFSESQDAQRSEVK